MLPVLFSRNHWGIARCKTRQLFSLVNTPHRISHTEKTPPEPPVSKSEHHKMLINREAHPLRDAILKQVSCPAATTGPKVSVIGSGNVGMAITFGLFHKKIVSQVALVADDEDTLKGEQMDMLHSSIFFDNRKLHAQTDYSITTGSSICIIAAGMARSPSEHQAVHLRHNLGILKTIIPEVLRQSPDVIFLIVTNPVDILTYATWRISGLPPERVLGSGTYIDMVRFQYHVADRLCVPVHFIQNAWVLGEHGDGCVPVWSVVEMNGSRLREIDPTIATPRDENDWRGIERNVKESATKILHLKGNTCWTIGLCTCDIVRSILLTCNTVCPVTTNAKGFYGITEDVFLSLPCLLCGKGISHIVKLRLTNEEEEAMRSSANNLIKCIHHLNL